jgi:hypothetical protein
MNAKGEVIGAEFDGDVRSRGVDYGYGPALNRTVAEHFCTVATSSCRSSVPTPPRWGDCQTCTGIPSTGSSSLRRSSRA